MSKAKIGIVTVSDRASQGVYEDLSGQAIIDTLNEYLTSEWEPVYQIIPDEQDQIEAMLAKMVDEDGCNEELLAADGAYARLYRSQFTAPVVATE